MVRKRLSVYAMWLTRHHTLGTFGAVSNPVPPSRNAVSADQTRQVSQLALLKIIGRSKAQERYPTALITRGGFCLVRHEGIEPHAVRQLVYSQPSDHLTMRVPNWRKV